MKKKEFILTLLTFAALMVEQCAWAQIGSGNNQTSSVTRWQAGPDQDGSAAKPFIITTPEDLQHLASEALSNSGFSGKYFQLGNDIDMSNTSYTSSFEFKGNFDGKGNTISGLTINSNKEEIGLFGYINGASVTNLTLSGATITGLDYVGGIAGKMLSSGTIQNCHVVGSTITVNQSTLPCVGAIVGYNNGGTLSSNTYHSTLVYAPNISSSYYKLGGTAFHIGVGYDKNDHNPNGDVTGAILDATQLFLADGRNNSALIAAYANPANHTAQGGSTPDFTSGIAVTLSGRKLFKDNSWNTLCMPFNASLTGDLASATLMELDVANSNLTEGTLTLSFKNATSIEAGKPYIIKWDGDGTNNLVNPVYNSVTISSTSPTPVVFTGGSFVGSYDNYTVTDADEIIYLGSSNKIGYAKTDKVLHPFRAHFSLTNGSAVCEFKLNFDDEDSADGIKNILPLGQAQAEQCAMFFDALAQKRAAKARNNVQYDDGWYTLDGRKLGKRPTAKGIYIHGGKKIVVR